MSEGEMAQRVLQSLQQTELADSKAALEILNGLVGLVTGDGTPHSFEVDEARASTFMAVCEYAKALHRGLPADELRPAAIAAAAKWSALAR
ncbi:hypothetical protein ACTZWT_08570 [Rhodopseudomonas sp. NSM]|uniref:hypothetical protein n=1 Tax=Rhodopseudomonas sp. NSM TaxID=3457630 RepID=UPI00403536C0